MKIKAKIEGAVPLSGDFVFSDPVEWRIGEGENWAVAGPNGAGKSVLADMLMRRIPLKEGCVDINTEEGRSVWEAVKSIGFRDIYSIVDCREAYYQQRWNADGRMATPIAGKLFSEADLHKSIPMLERFGLMDALGKHSVAFERGVA